jgi:predicted DNA-binding ribbon-helix-helix protein
MQNVVNKRSIVVAGHKTSVSLEDEFWNGLKEIGRSREITLSEIVSDIDTRRLNGNLSSAIRLFVLDHFQSETTGTAAMRGATIQQPQQSSQANGSGL